MIGRFMIWLIRLYQKYISPYTGRHCRYYPSCSDYAVEAIRVHGPLRGGWLAVRRLLRCNPFGGYGFDPVPQKEEKEGKHFHTEDL